MGKKKWHNSAKDKPSYQKLTGGKTMKVLLINSSPRKEGCTFTALCEIKNQLEKCGVEAEIFQLGTESVRGCLACWQCAKLGRCVMDDAVNRLGAKVKEADGYIFGSPVYFAGISGQLKSLMDRLFCVYGSHMRFKPAAAVTSARRAGTTPTLDDINRFFALNDMLIVTSQYWNEVHGSSPEEVRKDEEGLQIMRSLARNMAWTLKCLKAGREAGVPLPEEEPGIRTDFIR